MEVKPLRSRASVQQKQTGLSPHSHESRRSEYINGLWGILMYINKQTTFRSETKISPNRTDKIEIQHGCVCVRALYAAGSAGQGLVTNKTQNV